MDLHALVAAALENDLAVLHGHHEVVASGNDVGDAAVDDGPGDAQWRPAAATREANGHR